MNTQSGRSLIEMLGVLAIGTMISFGAIKMYQTVRTRQQRFIATQELKALTDNIKILYSARKDYSGISKTYLIKAGALKTEKIAGHDFDVTTTEDGKTFSIVFENLEMGDCAYFSTSKFDWADNIAVNNLTDSDVNPCINDDTNKIEFIVK